MDSFPDEVITNILARLPFKAIDKFKYIKPWLHIIHDSYFHHMHTLFHSSCPKDFEVIIHCRFGSCESQFYSIQDYNFKQLVSSSPQITRKSVGNGLYKMVWEFGKEDIIRATVKQNDFPFDPNTVVVMGSGYGLLWYSVAQNFPAFKPPSGPIKICNPFIPNQVHSLPDYHPNSKPYEVQNYVCGLGFDIDGKNFKIILVRCYKTTENNNEVQVHTLGSSKWRVIPEAAPEVLNYADSHKSSAFLNGFLHWVTMEFVFELTAKVCIVSFHVGKEEFSFVPIPDSESFLISNPRSYLPLSHYQLGVLEGYLTLQDYSHQYSSFRIWAMMKYGVKESWIKMFSIQKYSISWCFFRQNCQCIQTLRIQNNGEVLLLCDYKYIMSYNRKSKLSTPVEFAGMEKGEFVLLDAFLLQRSLLSVRMFKRQEKQNTIIPMDTS